MSRFSRGSGILLHPTSIPSEYGIGDLGENLIKFLELLKDNAQKYWQILPIGPTGYGDSPYQSLSSFAGNPLLISIDDLIAQNLISSSNLNEKFNTRYINFAKVKKFKFKILKEASRNFDSLDNYPNRAEDFDPLKQARIAERRGQKPKGKFQGKKVSGNTVSSVTPDAPKGVTSDAGFDLRKAVSDNVAKGMDANRALKIAKLEERLAKVKGKGKGKGKLLTTLGAVGIGAILNKDR